MLASPYGSPNVYSGYAFTGHDDGPPNGGTVNACYSDGWNCTHAWRQVANMVGFRNAVSGTALTNWWSNGNNAIAFGRGGKGYVAINRETGAVTQTFQTSLPAGTLLRRPARRPGRGRRLHRGQLHRGLGREVHRHRRRGRRGRPVRRRERRRHHGVAQPDPVGRHAGPRSR